MSTLVRQNVGWSVVINPGDASFNSSTITGLSTEMALRWWHATDTFFDYIPIWVQTTDTKLTALMAESSWQQAYQPSLVMPWIRSLLLRIQHKSHHLTPTRVTPSTRSKKLFQRIRKRKLENLGLDAHGNAISPSGSFVVITPQGQNKRRQLSLFEYCQTQQKTLTTPILQLTVEHVWYQLYSLGSFSVARFLTARRLRKAHVDKSYFVKLGREKDSQKVI